ncbi:MAG: ATP-binding protein [Chthoniobacterales bacterium]|nr:ATP-binding protein [Chthoniobacterales bacterium]
MFHELHETLADFRSKGWDELPIRPRWHRLVIGATGTGKSHLARLVSKSANLPFLSLSVTSWILMGCSDRAGEPTWQTIRSFLASNKRGVIFLDEIDKLDSNLAWFRSLKVEIYDLLDGRIPEGLRHEEITMDDYVVEEKYAGIFLTARLRTQFWIVAGGAFQDLWDMGGNSIGFGTQTAPIPTFSILSRQLDTELVNRFGEILVLPMPQRSDYECMLQSACDILPPPMRQNFLSVGTNMLDEATIQRKGARFVEEVLAKTIRSLRKRHCKNQPMPLEEMSRQRCISP